MAKKNSLTSNQRISKNFLKDMEDVKITRIMKGLAKPIPTEISLRELTELTTRTANWKLVLEELKTKPKRSKTF